MNHIELLDNLSHSIRGKILSTLEKQILKHLETGKTYIEIAEILGYEDGHIGSTAREIYGLIAQKHTSEGGKIKQPHHCQINLAADKASQP